MVVCIVDRCVTNPSFLPKELRILHIYRPINLNAFAVEDVSGRALYPVTVLKDYVGMNASWQVLVTESTRVKKVIAQEYLKGIIR